MMDTVVAAAIGVAALALIAGTVRSLVQLRAEASQTLRVISGSPASGPSGSEGSPDSGLQIMMFPDYVDEPMLDEVARQLGLQIEPVGLTFGRASRRALGLTAEVDTGLDVGPAHLGTSHGESDVTESEVNASLAIERRPDFRTKMRAVLRELERRGELETDLDRLPEDALPEATFMQAALMLRLEWGLADADADSEDPEQKTRVEIDKHLQAVRNPARTVIHEQIVDHLERAANERAGRFAHIESRWHVHEENGHPSLGISRIRTGSLVPLALPNREWVAAPSHEIWVPLASDHLLTHGQQRIKADHFVAASVFGRIHEFDAEQAALSILPIAVYSKQDPVEMAGPAPPEH